MTEAPELREMDDPEGMAIHNATQSIPELSISERLDQIEALLKFVPLPWYRRQLLHEYLELTTNPEERHERT